MSGTGSDFGDFGFGSSPFGGPSAIPPTTPTPTPTPTPTLPPIGIGATQILTISGPAFAQRLAQLFPRGWASDDAKQSGNVYSLLLSLGNQLRVTQAEVQYALAAQRLQTETTPELDDASLDFYGGALARRANQSDADFAATIIANLFQPAATRSALFNALAALTGSAPRMMEPWNVYDTGAWRNLSYWNVDTVANPARWGNGSLRYQGYIETAPPSIPAIGPNNPILAWGDSAYWNVPGYFFGIIQSAAEGAVNDLINRIRAYGTVVWLKLVSATSLGTVVPPGAVVSLTAIVAGPTSANISWQAPAGTPPFNYQVIYRVTGTLTFSAAPAGPSSNVTITGLLPNTSYDIEVIARNSAGFSQSPAVTASTSIIPPSPAQNVQATQVQATAITVIWNSPAIGTPPFTYSIVYWNTATPTDVQTLFVGLGATAVTIIGLQANTTYAIEVLASNL